MYGLVNKAIEGLVCQQFGEETWEKIRRKAEVDEAAFVSMQAYPDQITYRLVGAASEVLDVPAPVLLEKFGEYWTLYTVEEGYEEMLTMFGSNLREFLGNLDKMHARIAMGFQKLRPPSFQVEDVDGQSAVLLHYRSEREGLAPMVVGLIKGLAKRFSEEVQVVQVAFRGPGAHDVFRIDYKPA